MSGLKLQIASILALALILSAVPCVHAEQILQTIPADAVFCVRMNNLDMTASTIDSFAADAIPIPIAMGLRMQLAGLLSDPALANIDTDGNFAVFGMLPEDIEADDPEAFAEQMFAAGLLAVTDYDELVNRNPAISDPDDEGISMLKSTDIAGNDSSMIMIPVAEYALITEADNRAKLLNLSKSITPEGSLYTHLPSRLARRAQSEPVWVYMNLENVAEFADTAEETIQMIPMGIDTQMMQMSEGLEHLSISLQPTPSLATINITLTGEGIVAVQEMVQGLAFMMPPVSDLDRKNAAQLLPQSVNADTLGTINLIQMFGQITGDDEVAGSIETDDNYLAYAMHFRDRSLDIDLAIPQKHFIQLISEGMSMQQDFMEDPEALADFDMDVVEITPGDEMAEWEDMEYGNQDEPVEIDLPQSYHDLEELREQHSRQIEEHESRLQEDEQRRQERLQRLQEQLD